MNYIINICSSLSLKSELQLDLTLARGLNYYTGAIIEVKALDVQIGSITGGGRYDNLTGVFGMKDVSGVGISFGADRIYDVLNQLDLYPKDSNRGTDILFANLGEAEINYILPLVKKLRRNHISVEIYPDTTKLNKQLSYANTKNIDFVAIAGDKEMQDKTVTLKDMKSGEQKMLAFDQFILSFTS